MAHVVVFVMLEALKTVTSPKSLEKAREYINALDLQYIIDAMCSERYPLPRWTKNDAEHCCRLYKNFLFLIKKYNDESLVPSRAIDEFWHNHILYTENYTRDCFVIFGHYFHHTPADPAENLEVLAKQFLKTKAFYLEEFKQPLLNPDHFSV